MSDTISIYPRFWVGGQDSTTSSISGKRQRNKLRKRPPPPKPPSSLPEGLERQPSQRKSFRQRIRDSLSFGRSARTSPPQSFQPDFRVRTPSHHRRFDGPPPPEFTHAGGADGSPRPSGQQERPTLSVENGDASRGSSTQSLQPPRPTPSRSRSSLQDWLRNPMAVGNSNFIPNLDATLPADESQDSSTPSAVIPRFRRPSDGDRREADGGYGAPSDFADIGTAWHKSRGNLSRADLFGRWGEENEVGAYKPPIGSSPPSEHATTDQAVASSTASADRTAFDGEQEQGLRLHSPAAALQVAECRAGTESHGQAPVATDSVPQSGLVPVALRRPSLSESRAASIAEGEALAQEWEKDVVYRRLPTPVEDKKLPVDAADSGSTMPASGGEAGGSSGPSIAAGGVRSPSRDGEAETWTGDDVSLSSAVERAGEEQDAAAVAEDAALDIDEQQLAVFRRPSEEINPHASLPCRGEDAGPSRVYERTGVATQAAPVVEGVGEQQIAALPRNLAVGPNEPPRHSPTIERSVESTPMIPAAEERRETAVFAPAKLEPQIATRSETASERRWKELREIAKAGLPLSESPSRETAETVAVELSPERAPGSPGRESGSGLSPSESRSQVVVGEKSMMASEAATKAVESASHGEPMEAVPVAKAVVAELSMQRAPSDGESGAFDADTADGPVHEKHEELSQGPPLPLPSPGWSAADYC